MVSTEFYISVSAFAGGKKMINLQIIPNRNKLWIIQFISNWLQSWQILLLIKCFVLVLNL